MTVFTNDDFVASAGVLGMDEWLLPTVFCGMGLLSRAWEAGFLVQESSRYTRYCVMFCVAMICYFLCYGLYVYYVYMLFQ